MLENIPETFIGMRNKEFRVLVAIENMMKFHEWVPVEEIVNFTGYNLKEIEFIISHLAQKKLINKKVLGYDGYSIYFEAYDLLALNAFVKRGTINAIGDLLGIGKESVVYAATGGITDRELAIKFHTEGKISFKHVRLKREHMVDKKHISWLYASRLAAKKEYDALRLLYPHVNVPEPIDHNRNAIVMSVLKGQMLAHTKVNDPEWFLEEILTQVKKAMQLGIIHGDLSEFNIVVNPEGCQIFDWPQYITPEHPNAIEILTRDVQNILAFFLKKYRVKRDSQEVINSVIELCQK